MHISTNKAIQYLTTFRGLDWKGMQKYAKTHFREGTELNQVYTYLKKRKEQIRDGSLDLDKMHKAINKQIPKKSFQNLLSEFGFHIESYFAMAEMATDRFNEEYFLLKSLRKRGLHKQYDSLANKMRERLATRQKNIWTELNLLQIEHDQYLSNSPNKIKNGEQILRNKIGQLHRFTDEFAALYRCEAYNRDRQTTEDWKNEIERLGSLVQAKTNLSKKLDALHEVQKGSKVQFLKLFTWLHSNENKYSEDIKLIFLLYLNNNIPRLYKRHESRANKAIKAIEIGLQQNLYKSAGTIPVVRYHNIVDILCAYDQFELAEKIANEYITHLSQPIQSEALALAQAQIQFKNKALKKGKDKALEILRNISFKDLKLSIKSRAIILCCLYDLHPYDTDLIKSHNKAYIALLNRHKAKLTNTEFMALKNLSKYIYTLMRDKPKELNEISNSKEIIFFKSYILEKAKERLSSR